VLLVPETAIPVMESAALPLFVKVTGWPELGVPTNWPEKVKLLLERLTLGALGGGAGAPPPPQEVITHTE